MIKHVKGDLLDFYEKGKVDCIAHCVSNKGVMGAGIALQIKNRFPEAYHAYKDHESVYGLDLGTVSYEVQQPNNKAIINLHAQDGYGTGKRFINYEAFYKCLEKAKRVMNFWDHKTIGFALNTGCDRAGGDWRIVLAMIEVVFEDMDVLIVEWDKNKN